MTSPQSRLGLPDSGCPEWMGSLFCHRFGFLHDIKGEAFPRKLVDQFNEASVMATPLDPFVGTVVAHLKQQELLIAK